MDPDEVHVAMLPGRLPLNKPGKRGGSFIQSPVELWNEVVFWSFAAECRALGGGVAIPGSGVATSNAGLARSRNGVAIPAFGVPSPTDGVMILRSRVPTLDA